MSGPQRILLVEDEPLIAMMLEDFLDALGHQVAATADGVSAALQIIATTELDAAILDVNLRGGEQSWPIADALAAQGVPFVFATGGTQDGVIAAHRDRPTLAKPFTMESVQRAIDAL